MKEKDVEEYIDQVFSDFMKMTGEITPKNISFEQHIDTDDTDIYDLPPMYEKNTVKIMKAEVPIKIILESNHRTITVEY